LNSIWALETESIDSDASNGGAPDKRMYKITPKLSEPKELSRLV